MCDLLPFKELTLADKMWFDERVSAASGVMGCDYTFGNAFIWRYPYEIKALDYKGFLCRTEGAGRRAVYTMPVGSGDLSEVISDLRADASRRNVPFILRAATEEQAAELSALFPNQFDFRLKDAENDYIYSRENLTELKGKKFHGKRNHIARFVENPNWSYEKITPGNVDEAYEMAIQWCVAYDCAASNELEREFCAVKQTFANFFDLGFDGGILRLDGKIVGVTCGERLNESVYVVHIEKAFHEIQGAYPTLNQEFAKTIPESCVYINREEDDGDEGLRRAKLSYHPDIILRKYNATLISQRNMLPALESEPCAV